LARAAHVNALAGVGNERVGTGAGGGFGGLAHGLGPRPNGGSQQREGAPSRQLLTTLAGPGAASPRTPRRQGRAPLFRRPGPCNRTLRARCRPRRPSAPPASERRRESMSQSVLGIIGGSGVYDLPALKDVQWRQVASPWGPPSHALPFAQFEGLPIRFLPRHRRGHKLPPSAINFRANIDALKRAGVTDLISVSACGSLKEGYPPGHFVLVDQFIDRTCVRERSFFGPGCAAHVSMADP